MNATGTLNARGDRISAQPNDSDRASGAMLVGLYKLAIIGALIFTLTACFDDEDETTVDRIDNAAEEMSEGAEEAAEELDPNRTTGEEIGDAIEDTGEDIQDAAEE